jgi:hypothetical protein
MLAHFFPQHMIDRERVFLADPARGNLRMSVERFLDEWGGVIFVLGKPGESDITTYPLALPLSDAIQAERRGADRLAEPAAFPIHLAIRS